MPASLPPLTALETAMVASMNGRRDANLPRFDGDIVFPDHAGDFFSNDYLSVNRLPHIRQQFLDTLANEPLLLGSTGTRAIAGTTPQHVSLERYFSQQFDVEQAMIFNGGYMANLTFFGYAPQPGDVILYDEYIHASMHDGIRISRAANQAFGFVHNSLKDLESKIKQILQQYPKIADGTSTLFIVLESVYSMDGDFAPMEEIIDLVEKYVPPQSAHIAVDEAHSIGLFGPGGKGLLREWGLEKRVHSVIFPLTKAVNFIGGVLTTTPMIYQYLSNYARSWLYATSLPHVDVVGIKFCFEVMQTPEADELRCKVADNSWLFWKLFNEATRDIPRDVLSLLNPDTKNLHSRGLISPVFPLHTMRAVSLQHWLTKYGYGAHAIVYPGVPKGTDRVRAVIHGKNTEGEIRDFVKILRRWALQEASQTVQARL
ncbi:pyridoxal phosphate-dependent transferase [Ephemerocybe angulata]|uniref:Pyridoxal phosphate-dependent transferase n=1 Tax=Ephemerocybe angulata TaxID=980116 RepID=A0A8H6MGE3_9AGAR|nr:pyridoxal phosphate-dependent transferase [Tulosesus angulatus]KAF6765529.1 pyridoxal phosphate-dependent transferase [Tulosesus angulatus]